MSFQEELVENYLQLARERDWSVEQMADHLEPLDTSLAAEVRKQRGADPESKPKGRRSAGKSQA